MSKVSAEKLGPWRGFSAKKGKPLRRQRKQTLLLKVLLKAQSSAIQRASFFPLDLQ